MKFPFFNLHLPLARSVGIFRTANAPLDPAGFAHASLLRSTRQSFALPILLFYYSVILLFYYSVILLLLLLRMFKVIFIQFFLELERYRGILMKMHPEFGPSLG